MKLFLALLCAAGAASSRSLETSLAITDPTFDFSSLAFTLDYGVGDYITEEMVDYSLWDQNCKEGGVPVANDAFAVSISTPVASQMNGGGDRHTVKLALALQAEELTSDINIYEETTNHNRELVAVVTVCIRLGLKTSYSSPTIEEVNFHETMVTLNIRLTDGFSIDAIHLEPKANLVRMANSLSNELEVVESVSLGGAVMARHLRSGNARAIQEDNVAPGSVAQFDEKNPSTKYNGNTSSGALRGQASLP